MAAMIEERVVVLQPPELEADSWGARRVVNFDIDGASARARFREFFRNFRLENAYPYREALVRSFNRSQWYVEVDLSHLNEFDEVLFNYLQTKPADAMGFFESGAKDALKLCLTTQNNNLLSQSFIEDFQVIIKSDQFSLSLRNLTAEHVNSMIKVPGIVISCSKTRPKTTLLAIRCSKCQCVKVTFTPYHHDLSLSLYIHV